MEKIVFNNICKKYQNKYVLKDINFSIEKGKNIGIIGESGSGKSTLARILVGLEHYDSGEIFIDEREYKKLSSQEKKEKRKMIQLVFQNSTYAVNPNFTVEDVLLEPINILYKGKLSGIQEKIKSTLAMLELENVDLNQKARSLSGGQLQRLCFARALILQPSILVLDETLSGLDPLVQIKMLELLKKLQKEFDLTYVLISHNFYSCFKLCDKVMVLDNGLKVDEIYFDNNVAIINSELSEKLIVEDDPDIPYKFL